MTSSERHFLTLSDIHLGHNETPTEQIVKNLTEYLGLMENDLKFFGLKVIFFTGDLWDKSVQLGADFIPEFMLFWHRFCRWCIRHGISVRMLKGTPRHDGNQGSTVESITRATFPKLDFKYFDELCIDEDTVLGLTVLYVPDECRGSAEITYRDVKLLMEAKGISTVDLAMMHGMFKYQLGSIPLNHKVHSERDYLDIVKGVIAIGHIHQSSQYERIYAPGSFDRLQHGEEGPKGTYFFKEIAAGEWLGFFIENKGAKQYRTVELPDDLDISYQMLDEAVGTLPRLSNVRLAVPHGHPILTSLPELIKRYPEVKFTVKRSQSKKTKEIVVEDNKHRALVLNKETLAEAVISEIEAKQPITEEERTELNALISKLHH